MNIRNWSNDQIMQLPDHVFGQRWQIGMSVILEEAEPQFAIAEMALPERSIIWGVHMVTFGSFAIGMEFSFALGDLLPTTDAIFDGGELLFPGVVAPSGRRSTFAVLTTASVRCECLRMPVATAGRRFIMRAVRTVGVAADSQAVITISSIPTEVPDCLLSG